MCVNIADNRVVEFICDPAEYGDIPEPTAASNVLPMWYKALKRRREPVDESDDLFSHRTVKMCPAFLDALSLGWIIPFTERQKIDCEATGDTITWRSPWFAKLPEGTVLLVVDPMNRTENRFEIKPQLLDPDDRIVQLEIEALWNPDSGKTIINDGDPMAQVICLDRESMLDEASLQPFGKDGHRAYEMTNRRTKTNESWYRKKEWEPKATRVVDE